MYTHSLTRHCAGYVAVAGALALACSSQPSDSSATGGTTSTGTGGNAPSTGGVTQPTTGGTPSSTGGISATGGTTGGLPATGGKATGGSTGGSVMGGSSTGGTTPSSGGSMGGGKSGGEGGSNTGGDKGASTGGAPNTGGASATGGSGGQSSGGPETPGNYPLKNTPVKSSGCGTDGMTSLLSGATAVASGLATSKRVKITSGGEQREYIIDIPANYDNTKPYRLFYTSHWIGSTDTAVATGSVSNGGATNWGFYGLHRMAMAANDPAIFVAPQSQGSTWQQKDHALFDDILAKVSASLCIDTSRVFATGFSFGGMITYSLSTNHQKQIRAAVGIAPANYNIYLPNPIPKDPIAWMSTTGMSDGTCPWDGGNNRGAKYIATQRAMDNGCTAATIPTWTSGSPARHVCYDYVGCKSNYPVKACTFNGNHQAAPHDAGSGDNGLTSWIPSESWKFFAQF